MLTDKVAMVTGGSQGLGKAICDAFLAANARVVLLDKSVPGDGASGILEVLCDVANSHDCEAAMNVVVKQFGKLDILVNCAGILMRDSIDSDTAMSGYDKTMQVNVGGIVNVVRAALPELRKSAGVILNIASIQSFVALSNSFAYNASKGAVLQLTKALASELATDGIRVNSIAPGWMETRMNEQDATDDRAVQAFLARVPLKRLGKPEDMGGAAVFLCSDMSRYVTGITLPVDGGFLAV